MKHEIDVHIYVHSGSTDPVLKSIAELRTFIMTSNAELVTQLNDLKTELNDSAAQNAKAQAEITAAVTANTAAVATLTQKVADLEAQIAAGGADVPPEVVQAVADLKVSADAVKASSQALDDLNPDVTP